MGCITEFISKMDYAYAAADLVVSRAGAIAIAEICATGKASILVPYPLAAEDHQTKNAMALVNKGAALLVKDAEATERLGDTVGHLMANEAELKRYATAIGAMAQKDAAERIVEEVKKLIQ